MNHQYSTTSNQNNYQNIQKALDYLDPNCDQETWMKIGTALKDAGDEYLELWDRWSSGGASYKSGECDRKWKHLNPNKVTIGTLFYLAKENGFEYERNGDRDDSKKLNEIRALRKAQREAQEKLAKEQQKNSLTNLQREIAWQEILDGLTLADDHRQKFLNRGFTEVRIDRGNYRTIEKYQQLKPVDPNWEHDHLPSTYEDRVKWRKQLAGVSSDGTKLLNSGRGILTPVDDYSVLGCQYRLDDGGDGGRYRWLSSPTSKAHLQNGELPIGLYEGDLTKKIETAVAANKESKNKRYALTHLYYGAMGIAEGARIKPQLAANKFGITMIGAAGGQWAGSPEQLKKYLASANGLYCVLQRLGYEISIERGEPYICDHHGNTLQGEFEPKNLTVILFPDAGSHNDDGVMARLTKTWELIKSWGYEVEVAWWGQFNKVDGDIDEISQEQFEAIEYISTSDFEHLSLYALRKADIELNRRYLTQPKGFGDTFNFLSDIPDDKFGVGCKSYKGTGKNRLQAMIADHLHKEYDQPRPILYITQLANLIRQASEPPSKANPSGLGLVNIYDIENCHNNEERRELLLEASIYGLAVTYDSLLKLKALMPDFTPLYTFLDEAESGCECLLDAGTDIKNHRTETITYLSELLQRSKAKYDDAHVYMWDSDLTNISVDYFCSLVGETVKDAFIIRNDYKVAQGRIAYIYEDAKTWVKDYSEADDRNICFANSQRITSKFSAQNLGELTGDALVIDAETTKDKTNDAYRALHGDISELMSKYQRTVHTSAMGIGVSINKEGLFDSRWAITYGLLGVGKFLQGVDRYRPNIPLHLFVQDWGIGKFGSGSSNWKTLAKQAYKNRGDHITELAIADIDSAGGLKKSVETWAKLMARRNYELTNYRQSVERQLKLDGYTIIYVESAGDKTASTELKELRDGKVYQYCGDVAEADISDELEMKRIEAAKEHTPEERIKLAKKKISDSYLIPVTPKLVEQDLKDGIYSKFRLHYYLTVGVEYLPKRDKTKLEMLLGDDKLLFAPDANKSLLSGKIAMLRKIEVIKFIESIGNDALTNDDDRAIAFNKILISNYYRFPLRRHLGLTVNPQSKPITNIEKVLKVLGFELVRDEASKKNKTAGEYEIKPISRFKEAVFAAWLERDFNEKVLSQNAETTNPHRKFINNNIVIEKFAEFAKPDDQHFETMAINSTVAIAPAKLKPPNEPSPPPKPSNKPTQPPKNVVWRKGMKAMYQGLDWAIGTLGTATAKIVRNGFELWVDIPDLGAISV